MGLSIARELELKVETLDELVVLGMIGPSDSEKLLEDVVVL